MSVKDCFNGKADVMGTLVSLVSMFSLDPGPWFPWYSLWERGKLWGVEDSVKEGGGRLPLFSQRKLCAKVWVMC